MTRFRGRRNLERTFRNLGRATRDEVARELLRGGLMIEDDAVVSIQEQTPSGRFYPSRGRKGAMHEASPPGAAPNADTGELHTSITSVRRETAQSVRVETGANTPYATALELGTAKMAPRPFMSPAFRANVNRIAENVRTAVRRAGRRRGR